MLIRSTHVFLIFVALLFFSCKSKNVKQTEILSTPGLVALWDFSGEENRLTSKGDVELSLRNGTEDAPRFIEEGPLSGRSISFDGSSYFYIPYDETAALNIKTNEVRSEEHTSELQSRPHL